MLFTPGKLGYDYYSNNCTQKKAFQEGEMQMLDFLNRQRMYLNSRIPHVPNNKEQAIEENNTIVVKHTRTPFKKRIKKMFRHHTFPKSK